MAPVTIVVPTNVAGIVARRHLAAGVGDGRPGVAALDVTTLDRLAERLAAPSLAPRRPVTPPVLAAAWRSALATGAGCVRSRSRATRPPCRRWPPRTARCGV